MANNRRMDWDKQGDFDGHASFDKELPAGVRLGAPDAELHQETSEGVWVDRTSEVTIVATVVDARDPRKKGFPLVTGGESRAVRVVITVDPDPQPDATDEPEPGENYRIKVIATRSDSGRPEAREIPLTVHP